MIDKYHDLNVLLYGFFADWNDCLELGQKGETVFMGFQLRYALKIYEEIRKKRIDITVKNGKGVQQGISKLVVNDKVITDNFISYDTLEEYNKVMILMG